VVTIRHVDAARLLLRRGAPGLGEALDAAAGKGCMDLVVDLLAAGAPLAGDPTFGDVPLWDAAKGKHSEVARLLLSREPEAGAERRRRVALGHAAGAGDYETVRVLLDERGAHAADLDEASVLRAVGMSIRGKEIAVTLLLLDTGVCVNAAMRAVVESLKFREISPEWFSVADLVASRGGRVQLAEVLYSDEYYVERCVLALLLLSLGACEASSVAGTSVDSATDNPGLAVAVEWAAGRHPLQAERRAVASCVSAWLPAVLVPVVSDFVHVVRGAASGHVADDESGGDETGSGGIGGSSGAGAEPDDAADRSKRRRVAGA
jgi:Ankyrin repeats (3 copies)